MHSSCDFQLEGLIQEGLGSLVYAVRDETGGLFALKYPRGGSTQTYREADILPSISHPHIIELQHVIPTTEGPALILPLAGGGDLLSKIENGPISEALVQQIAYNILTALLYLHDQSIWHCDVKPDNILFLKDNSEADSLVLADFGLARKVGDNISTEEGCGSPLYEAPELHRDGRVTKAVDLWALGVTLYACLTGKFPYSSGQSRIVTQEILNGLPSLLQGSHIPYVSDCGKDFVRSLLRVNPEDRATAREALKHPWLESVRKSPVDEQGNELETDWQDDSSIEYEGW
jgi:serine/threonine protein kinase